MWGARGHRHESWAEQGPHFRYPCRDPEEIYEPYDDVEATDSSPSPKGKGLLVVGVDPASLGAWDINLLQGPFLPHCWCKADHQSSSLTV